MKATEEKIYVQVKDANDLAVYDLKLKQIKRMNGFAEPNGSCF